MKKQYLAMAAVFGLGMFALANPGETGTPEPQAEVVRVVTDHFCEEYQDGRMVEFVCRGGFTDAIEDILKPVLPSVRPEMIEAAAL